jgi:hypothetical protein
MPLLPMAPIRKVGENRLLFMVELYSPELELVQERVQSNIPFS